MKREPLTSTVAPGRASERARATSASISAKCSAPSPNAAVASRDSCAQREQARDAALARVGAHFAMELGPALAHFAHVAHHEHARLGLRAQHVDRGAHRIGVGVVRVVDQRGARGRAAAHQATGHRPERGQARGDRGGRDAGGMGRGRRGQRVAHVVRAVDGQPRLDRDAAGRWMEKAAGRACGSAHTASRASSPNSTRRRAPACARQTAACSSSPGYTATPSPAQRLDRRAVLGARPPRRSS
jgi:hypothetical protein